MTFVRDMSLGMRSLRRRPAFTLAAGLSLAMEIGVTTAIFTVLNAVVLRPLPYSSAGRLVWLTQVLKKNGCGYFGTTVHWARKSRC